MGVGRIKGITVEIGGDTTKLQTALKGVSTEIKNTQSQLKDVQKLLKLDPGNTELLSQKQKLLASAVSQTKQKLETLKTAAEQANQALANGEISQEQYDALQREIVETEQELKKLEKQAGESATALQEIAAKGEKLKTVGENISNVGEKFLPATAAITGLGAAAVKTAADFDSQMSKVSAISGATGEDLEALREKAREMGSKTKFSASEAASAMEYMAMAGWKTGDMLGGIEGIMNLAAASGEDLATTSDIVTDALTAFGLSANDAGHFSDILASASSNANTNVSMLGQSFKYAAPVAGSLGISAEDTSIALGLMANAGIKASQAGTALRTGLTNMAKPTNQMAAYMDRYNIALVENADGSVNLRSTMISLREKMGGLSESEQAAAASAIFGKNAMAGWLSIINASDQDFDKLIASIDNCDGESQRMAETMQDNLAGQLTILKSQLEELAISFGEMLIPVIRDVVTWIQGFVDKLNGMDEGTRRTIITIAAVVAAIGPVLIVVGKVISAVGTIMTIVPKVAGAIKAVQGAMVALNAVMLANPIALVVAAIAALVAAFIYLWNTNEEFRQFWIGLWETVKNTAIAVWNAISTFFTAAWSAIRSTAETVFTAIRDFFTGIWTAISTTVSTVWNWIVETIGGALTSIWTSITSVWTSIVETLSPLLEAFRYLFETIFQAIQILIGMALDGIAEKIKTAWTAIVGFLTPILQGLKTTFQTIWNAISSVVSTALSSIKSVVTSVWNAIKSTVSSILNAIKSVVSTAWNGIKSTVSTVLGAIRSNVTTIWNSIKSGIASSISGIVSTIRTGFNNAVTYIRGLASKAYNWGRDIIRGIVNGIKATIGNVANAAKKVAKTIRSYLHFSVPDTGPLTDYESWMPDFMSGLAEGIEKSRGLIQSAIGNVSEDMVVSPNVTGTAAMAEAPGQSGSSSNTLLSLLAEYLPYLPQLASMTMVTDTGALVGQLAPQMNEQLGVIAMRQRRQ